MREDILSAVKVYKIIAIMRGVESDVCLPIAEALYQGGIKLLEITYNQLRPDSWETTARTIQNVAARFEGRMHVGAGTVTNPELVKLTATHGGGFIISPNTRRSVIEMTRDLGLVSIPGAMTPSEILDAHDYGADLVKLFPASEIGTGYIRAVKAPISHVDLIATGGISVANAKAFLEAGASGLGVGGSLTNKAAIAEKRYDKLTAAAAELCAAIA